MPIEVFTLRRLQASLAATVLGLGLIAGSAHGQDTAMDPQAAEILKAMSDTLAGAGSFAVEAETLYDVVQPGGIVVTEGRTVHLFVRRPDGMHARADMDTGARGYFWYDGASFSRLIDLPGETPLKVSTTDAPDTLDATLDMLADQVAMNLPLADFVYSEPFVAFEDHLISGAYLGQRMVGGTRAHHLSFESEGADFQIWVAADGPALPLRFAVAYVLEPGEPRLLMRLRDWELDPYLDPGMFSFTAPEGAETIEFATVAE